LQVPRETGGSACAGFGGTNRKYYGIFRSGPCLAKGDFMTREPMQTEETYAPLKEQNTQDI